MASTLAQLRDLVRSDVGDVEILEGVATGGSVNEIDDTTLLGLVTVSMINRKVHIRSTSDGNAPKGETRTIKTLDTALNKITTTIPFTASVQSGDEYYVAVFSDQRINQEINNALTTDAVNKFPFLTTAPLNITPNKFLFQPANSDRILWINTIEELNEAENRRLDYDGFWRWDRYKKMIVFDFQINETKTLSMDVAMSHAALTVDSAQVTVDPFMEPFIVKLASAGLLGSLNQQEFKNEFGELKPKSWKRGDVSMTFGEFTKSVESFKSDIIKQIYELVKKSFTSMEPRSGNLWSGRSVAWDTRADPDGRPMPQIFWTINQ